MSTKGSLGCALVLSCLAACSAEPVGAHNARATPAQAPPPLMESERLPLAERLRREATRHPEARAQVEQLLQDLAREDIVLVRTRQVLAAPLGADYCAAGLSTHGLGLSLCRFADAPRAEQGLKRSHQSFDRLIPGRTLLRNGATLLTLTRAPEADAAAESERAARRFSSGARASL